MREVEPFGTDIGRDGWRFPIRPLTESSRAKINACAACPRCRARVTLEAEKCKCGYRYVSQNRRLGPIAFLQVPFKVTCDIQSYQNRRWRAWEAKRIRKDMLARAEGRHNIKDIFRLWEAQKGKCYYCAQPFEGQPPGRYCKDHVIPVCEGGGEWPSNLVLACHLCNGRKGARSERQMWQTVRKSKGAAWVAKRRKALTPFYEARAAIDWERREADAREFPTRPT